MDPYLLTKDDAFAGLAAAGAARAEVAFSGGHDEGGVNSITLLDADGNVVAELEEWHPGSTWDAVSQAYVPERPPTAVERLAYTLAKPVDDRYSSFDGEFSVDGTVVWDVATRTVTIEGTEYVETGSSFEEVWDDFPGDDREEG